MLADCIIDDGGIEGVVAVGAEVGDGSVLANINHNIDDGGSTTWSSLRLTGAWRAMRLCHL